MKNYFTYIGGFVAIVLIGAGVLWGVQEYRYRKSPEYQAMKYFEDVKKLYENDTYGGATPEETLQLFVDALKKGDVDLASKYFVVEDQGKFLNDLKEIKAKNNIERMITDLQKAEWDIRQDKAFLTLVNNNKVVISELVMYKVNNKWKISEL